MEPTLVAQIQQIKNALEDKKGENIVALDLQSVSESLSYFVIASGNSQPQLEALERNVRDEMVAIGIRPNRVEGPSPRWILIDYGAILVHIMTVEAREYYDIEGFWADGKKV
jgi:ribosome-associated protein